MEAGNEDTEGWGVTLPPLPPVHTVSHHGGRYTDEDPKGTIQGLQFKNKRAAALSVAKIKRSNRSHNHKTQAAIAMEQRAEVAGKDAAASVYRKFIEEQKRKTKEKNA